MTHGLAHRLSIGFAALGQRSFRYLFFSSLALSYSQWFQQIGLGWLVLQITGSAAQLGGVTFVNGVMVFLASMPGGVMADRYNRRTILVWTTALSVLQALGLALLVFSGQVQPWHLYVFGFVGGIINGVSHPVRQSMVYDLTSPALLTNAVTMSSMSWSLARVSGPPVAGMLLGFFDTSSTFFIAAILIAVAMVMTLQIPASDLSQPESTKDESAVGSVMSGLKYALRDPIVLPLFLAFSIAPILVYPYIPFLAVFAVDVLHGGPELYGVLATGVGWGSLIGLSALTFIGDVKHKGRQYLINQVLYFSFVLAFANSTWFPLSMLLLVGAGVFNSTSGVLANTLFQLAAKNEMRGRVMALLGMSQGVQPAGSLVMGLGIERWGAPGTVSAFMAVAIGFMTLIAVAFPALRRSQLGVAKPEEAEGPPPAARRDAT